MNKIKSGKIRLIYLLSAIAIFVVIVFCIKSLENFNYIKAIKKFVEKDTKVVYISDKKNYSQYPIDLLSKYGINYLYINSSNLSGIEKNKLEKVFNSKYLNNIIIVYNDGKIIDAIISYESEDKLIDFFRKNNIIPESDSNPEKVIKKLESSLENDLGIIYIPYNDLEANDEQKNILKDISKQYDLKYDIVEAYLISLEQQKKINLTLDISDVEDQIVIFVKDKKVIGNIRGLHTKEEYVNELRKFKMIENTLNEINEIDYEKFLNITDSKDKNIIVIGKNDCKYCDDALNTLNTIASDYELKINYFNVETQESENFKKVKEKLEKMDYKDSFTTPLILITESEKILDYMIGVSSYEYYEEKLMELGIIK